MHGGVAILTWTFSIQRINQLEPNVTKALGTTKIIAKVSVLTQMLAHNPSQLKHRDLRFAEHGQ